MANIDNIILGVDASNPTNSLEKWVAKINGTYNGDIPEPTSDIEKTLKKYYEEGGHNDDNGGTAAEWNNIKVLNSTGSNLTIGYVSPSGVWESLDLPSMGSPDGYEIPFTTVKGSSLLSAPRLFGFITVDYIGASAPNIAAKTSNPAVPGALIDGNVTTLSSGEGSMLISVNFNSARDGEISYIEFKQ